MPLLLLFSQNAFIPPSPTWIAESWWSSLVGVVQSSCPELNYIIRAQSINRANWLNLLKNSRLTPPYLVIETMPDKQEDWSRDYITFRQPVNLYYVSTTNTASASLVGGGYDATKWAENRALNLRNGILSYSGSGFQILNKYPSIDVSEQGSGSSTMYTLQSNFQVGTCNAELFWGYSFFDLLDKSGAL